MRGRPSGHLKLVALPQPERARIVLHELGSRGIFSHAQGGIGDPIAVRPKCLLCGHVVDVRIMANVGAWISAFNEGLRAHASTHYLDEWQDWLAERER